MTAWTRVFGLVALSLVAASALAAQTVPPPVAPPPPPPPPSSQPANTPGTALIVGQVVDAMTGGGVPDVAVTPSTPTNGGQPRAIATDDEGHFVLRNLPAGTYTVTAQRSGYATASAGATRPVGTGQPISLEDGQRIGDVTIRMWKLAAIAGAVVDESGDPAIGVEVRALKRTLVAGRWRLGDSPYGTSGPKVLTDDRGMYRFADLVPGDYVIALPFTTTVTPAATVEAIMAMQSDPSQRDAAQKLMQSLTAAGVSMARPGEARGVQVGDRMRSLMPGLPVPANVSVAYATQYFPGVTSPSRAQALTVRAGEERASVDFTVKPVRAFAVSGVLMGQAGPVANAPVRLIPTDADALLSDISTSATLTGADGRFTLLSVPPGSYVVRALQVPVPVQVTTRVGNTTRMEQSPTPSEDPTTWATASVSVSDADVTNLSLIGKTGARIGGSVTFEGSSGQPTAAQLTGMTVMLESADGSLVGNRYGDDRTRLNAGRFLTAQLPPGRYLVRPQIMPGGWTLVSAMTGGRDVSETPLDLTGEDVLDVTLTFTSQPSYLLGTVRNDRNATASAVVLVFPADKSRWLDYGTNTRRLQEARASSVGLFRSSSLPAGEYLAAAVVDPPAGDWREPAFLEALARVATHVTIGEHDVHMLDLHVVSARSQAVVAAGLPASALLRRGSPERDARRRQPCGPCGGLKPAAYEDFALTHTQGGPGPHVGDEIDAEQQIRDAGTQTIAPPPTGSGVIAGTVQSAGVTNAPVKRAVVTLSCTAADSGPAGSRVGRTTVTDDRGRFEFATLPPCRYSLTATKPNYVTAVYGAAKPGRAGTPISLGPDEHRDVTVAIAHTGAITGVIRDGRGRPLSNVRVQAMQWRISNGERTLSSFNGETQASDDRGVYRVWGLTPGDYVIGVERPNIGFFRSLPRTTAEDLRQALQDVRAGSSSAPGAAPSVGPTAALPTPQPVGYAPAFFPGTAIATEATTITLAAGDERTGVDFSIQLVPFTKITGRAIGPDGQPPRALQTKLVQVTPLPGMDAIGLSIPIPLPSPDGRFTVAGVPPGQYVLHIGGTMVEMPPMGSSFTSVSGVGTAIGLPLWAMMPLTADGREIDNLEVRLEAGKTMTGRVVFDGTTTPPANLASVSVGLTGQRLGELSMSVPSKPLNASAQFSLDSVIPGPYRVSASRMTGWMVKSAIVNGHDAADLPVDITGDVSDVVVTFTDRLTELSGTLQTPAGEPAIDYHVIVFPADRAYWLTGSRRIASLRPSTDGQFSVKTLPPGDYLIAAVVDVQDGEWFDPSFLSTLTGASVKISLGEGEKKRQDLQIKR